MINDALGMTMTNDEKRESRLNDFKLLFSLDGIREAHQSISLKSESSSCSSIDVMDIANDN